MVDSIQPCSLHKTHEPRNLTVEEHHVIPRAWQRFYAPSLTPVYAGHYDGEPLWDARTVPICPTGHRNTHALIVRTMRQVATTESEDIGAAAKAAGVAVHTPTGATALLALERFTAAGGKLLELTAAGELGEA